MGPYSTEWICSLLLLFQLHDINSSPKNSFAKFLCDQSTQIVVFRACDLSSKRYIALKQFEDAVDRKNFHECFNLAFTLRKCNYIIIQTDPFCQSELINPLCKLRTDIFNSDSRILGYCFSSNI